MPAKAVPAQWELPGLILEAFKRFKGTLRLQCRFLGITQLIDDRLTSSRHPPNPPNPPSETVLRRPISIINRKLAGCHHSTPTFRTFDHWAVMVGDFMYELCLDETAVNEATSSPWVHGATIRLRIGEAPKGETETWKESVKPRGKTELDDAGIKRAGVCLHS